MGLLNVLERASRPDVLLNLKGSGGIFKSSNTSERITSSATIDSRTLAGSAVALSINPLDIAEDSPDECAEEGGTQPTKEKVTILFFIRSAK